MDGFYTVVALSQFCIWSVACRQAIYVSQQILYINKCGMLYISEVVLRMMTTPHLVFTLYVHARTRAIRFPFVERL